jgi:hypothetical protein
VVLFKELNAAAEKWLLRVYVVLLKIPLLFPIIFNKLELDYLEA